MANAAIAANVAQFAKELAPARKSGMKPVLVACRMPPNKPHLSPSAPWNFATKALR